MHKHSFLINDAQHIKNLLTGCDVTQRRTIQYYLEVAEWVARIHQSLPWKEWSWLLKTHLCLDPKRVTALERLFINLEVFEGLISLPVEKLSLVFFQIFCGENTVILEATDQEPQPNVTLTGDGF